MNRLLHPSSSSQSDQLSILLILIIVASSMWALSFLWPTSTASLATTFTIASSALAYFHGRDRNRHKDNNGSRAVVSPRFIQPSSLGQVAVLTGPPPSPQHQQKTIHRPFLFSSTSNTNSTNTNSNSTAAPNDENINRGDRQHQQQQTQKPLLDDQEPTREHQEPHQQQPQQNDNQRRINRHYSIDGRTSDRNYSPQTSTNWDSPVEVIAADSLEFLEDRSDPRIWDHIVVGDGREALICACDLAQQHPSNRILLVLEHTIQSNVTQRVVQRIQKILATQVQGLWAHEAMDTLSPSARDHTLHQGQAGALFMPQHNQGQPHSSDQLDGTDYSTLPTNLGICPGYTATGILIDKPRTQRQQPSTGATLTSKPLKRFSSVGGSQRSNNLTVNTTVSTPSRTVGLSICPSSGSSTDTRYRILCRNEVVFANEKHPLVQSLDATTTPPTSKDDFAGGSSTSDRTDDQPPRASMVFSIKMKYSRTRPQSSVTQAAEHFLSQGYSSLDGLTASGSNRHPAQIQLQPVLLHRCYPIHQQGRISLTETTEREDSFRLDIHAWSKSLELSSPIELEVSVVTSPVRQIAFGNSDVIRNGEDVLLEGLALARTMAQQAGWKCLEEDDSSMIEWVRDEMSIQWSSERVSNQDQWQSVCSNVEGVKRPRRSRTVSNGSVRVKTPTLSPYSSRTHSFHGKKQESSSMPGHRRHSTLERLKEASETLLEHEAQSKEDHLTAKDGKESADQKSSKVTIAAVEPVSPQRPGIKTSFGGFSSLNESRSHSLALAEETEDHLGVALSIPSSNGGQTSPKDRQDQVAGAKFFGEGITPAEIIGTDLGNESPLSSNPSPPEPRKLSRFSIKSYRMERDNTGLSDEWGLGSLNASSLFPTPPSSTSSLKKNDLLTTPPLLAETTSSLGSVSPLSPSAPGEGQVQDFLSGSNASPPKFGSGVSRPQQFGKNLFSGTSSSSTISSTDDQPKTVSESSNQIDNSSRRSFGVFGPRQSFSAGGKAVGSSSSTGNSGISPLDAPVELIPDFLGASFPAPKTLSGRKESVSAGGTSLARVQSTPSVSAVKAVHFADSGVDGEDGLRRVESDPCTAQLQKASLGDVEDDTDMQATLDALRRPSLTTDFSMSSSRSSSSTSSSSSKSKAHTRRSWGQGIGGSDIQGIQGLE